MPQTGPLGALAQTMALLRELMKSTFRMKNGLELRVSASVGVASAPTDSTTVHNIIGVADTRMYAVKASGRGAVRGA